VWIYENKGYNGLAEIGKKFEQDLGIKVTVERPEGLPDKFQAAAQSGKGPDIVVWGHDRLGEWVEAGLLKPINVGNRFKRKVFPMAWEAVSYDQQIYGYPLSLEVVSLIYNKKYLTGPPPAQLTDFPALAKQLRSKYPRVTAIMWDYVTTYFSWPFLASGGGYPFKKTPSGYDVNDIGVDTSGAVRGLTEIVNLIKAGVLPKGSSYSVMDQKMNSGELATMISGPWAWAKLRKSGIDFGLAPIPGVDGNAGRPFVGVLAALINRSTANSDIAARFIEKYVATDDGLKTINADVPIGVPVLKSAYDELAAFDPLIKTTYESAGNGEVMPNIPQMGKFWSSMQTALQIATHGEASPQVALADAQKKIAGGLVHSFQSQEMDSA
jgi:maltose/maltodextrin transport system substrate-binding protein